MQVFCANCQLTFDAPEGTAGLVCPICRNPLRADGAAGDAVKPSSKAIDWNGGALTDLIALLSAPAVSARVEVIPTGADAPIGEVHLVAGGVSDSIYDGQATDDALDRLLTITPARFRVLPVLPHPTTGALGTPGPESGTLDGRPLAHLMRYCEDYVITCAIEVWRGNETARVDYRRGEISGVTVGGIDAPERLAEVMQWASGNYRLDVPAIQLPAVAPRRTTAPAMPILSPAEPATAHRSATKTMFGIPLSEIAAARAAAEAIMQAQGVGTPAPPEVAPPPVAPATQAPVAATAPAPVITPPGVAPSAVPAPMAASRASATKTIFGVPAPSLPQGFTTDTAPAEPAAPETSVTESDTGRTDRITKTGARKVAVPAPAIVTPVAPPPAAAKDVGRTTQFGFDPGPSAEPKKADKSRDKSADKSSEDRGDKTQPVRAPAPRPQPRQAPIWTYVGVGFTFGLVLLGIYQLVGRLAH
ncbi:MAG TPA: hypothetical protein VLA14_18045 [Polyangia bacterium]|nr:hypothetical protein [Polyangia bacterium]